MSIWEKLFTASSKPAADSQLPPKPAIIWVSKQNSAPTDDDVRLAFGGIGELHPKVAAAVQHAGLFVDVPLRMMYGAWSADEFCDGTLQTIFAVNGGHIAYYLDMLVVVQNKPLISVVIVWQGSGADVAPKFFPGGKRM